MPTWPLALLLLYFAPTLAALANRQPNLGQMFLTNLALGSLAWPALLIGALLPPAE